MDIEDIEELANRLIEAGLDEETVESILNDLVEIDDETQTEQFYYDETINPEVFTRISNRLIIDSVYYLLDSCFVANKDERIDGACWETALFFCDPYGNSIIDDAVYVKTFFSQKEMINFHINFLNNPNQFLT